MGRPYRVDGRDPADGLDCVGVAVWILGEEGVELPPITQASSAAELARFARAWRRVEAAERFGDLIHVRQGHEDGLYLVLEGGYWAITSSLGVGVNMKRVSELSRRPGSTFYRLRREGEGGQAMELARPPGAAFAIGLIVSALLSGAVYAISRATAPRPPDRRRFRESPTYGFDGLVNTVRPGELLPIVYGEHRVGGHVISSFQTSPVSGPFLDAEDSSGVLNTLLAVCSGGANGIESITGLRIDRNPVDNFRSAVFDTRLGTLSQAPVPGFDEVRTQVLKGDSLTVAGGALTYTTQGEIDRFGVAILFPAGLHRINSSGSVVSRQVEIRIEYRVTGTVPWSTLITDPIRGKTQNPKRVFFESARLDRAKYDVRVTRISADESGSVISGTEVFAVTEITMELLSYPGIAIYGVRQLPTSQFSGAPPTYDVVVRGRRVKVFTGPGAYTIQWSENPAWCLFDFLTDPVDGLGPWISEADLIIEDFLEWAAFCDELVPTETGLETRYRLGLVVDGTQTHGEVVRQIAATGQASFALRGNRWGIVIDRDEPPAFELTMGRITEGQFQVAKPRTSDAPNTLIGEFANRDLEYEADQLIKEDPLLAAGAELIEGSLQLAGTTRPSQANRLLNYHMLASRLQRREVELETGVEAIHAEAGQIVRLSHDVPLWGRSGKILRVEAGGSIITLDRDVTIEGGKFYELTIPHIDDSGDCIDVATVANPAGTTDRLLITQGLSRVPEPGDDYAFGEVGKSTALYRILAVTRADKPWRRRLRLRQHDTQVYTGDPTALPTPSVSALPDPRRIPAQAAEVRLVEDQLLEPDGTLANRLSVYWTPPVEAGVSAKVYYRQVTTPASQWDLAGETRAGFLAIGGVEGPGVVYEVSVVTCSQFGACRHPDDGARASLTTAGVTRQPSNVTGFRVDATFDGLVFTWTAVDPATNPDLSHYEIRQGTSWATGIFVGRTAGAETELRTEKFNRSVDGANASFHIKAVNLTGNASVDAATATILLTGRINENLVLTQQEDTAFGGTKVNCFVESNKLIFDTPTGTYTTAKFQVSTGNAVRSLVQTVIDAIQVDKTLTWESALVANETWDGAFATATRWADLEGLTDAVRLKVEMRFSTTGSDDGDFGAWALRSQQFEVSVKWAQARLTVEIDDENFRVEISKLRFLFDVPDVFDRDSETTSASGTISVSYNRTFNSVPRVVATIIGATAGDEIFITNKTSTGFTLSVKDTIGQFVSRTVEWQAQGF